MTGSTRGDILPPPVPEPIPIADLASLDATLAANLQRVLADVSSTANAVGRAVPDVVLVTKSASAVVTCRLLAIAASERPGLPVDLAENRADAFRDKVHTLEQNRAAGAASAGRGSGPLPRWHFIGHLQRNKARRVLERADVLHSIDSARLAEAVVRITSELERTVDVYVEVNLTGESEKHGLQPSALDAVLDTLAGSTHVRVLGLMVMGPLAERGKLSVDDVFGRARALADELDSRRAGDFTEGRCRLSMGMSGDLQAAIRHGSDAVRVGSALFEGVALGATTDNG